MKKENFAKILAALLMVSAQGMSNAQDNVVKIGVILPMTGPFATTGRQSEAGMRLYMAQHGNKVAGKTIELELKDDAGTPDNTRRIAQQMAADKVTMLAGFGITPAALAVAPLATQAKLPMIVTAAATSSITESSPFIVRTGFTLPQVSIGIGDWAAKNGIKKVVSLVTDYGPGFDAEKAFKERFEAGGGQVIEQIRTPVRNPDFAAYLQRVRDAKPDALFVFVPAGQGSVFMKQFVERGLAKSGIKLIATGDVTDDDLIDDMGDAALGVITSHHYSAAHNTVANKAFVNAFMQANNGLRPNFMAVGAYDGMRVIYKALDATKGAGGEALVNALRGQSFESPRGPVSIDPVTRDIVQNVYIRRVERVANMGNKLFNVEFATLPNIKDPGKTR